jgi:hypothetical protein
VEPFLHILKNQLLRQRYARVPVENPMAWFASSFETIRGMRRPFWFCFSISYTFADEFHRVSIKYALLPVEKPV